jgi:hypothetical protein
MISLFKKNLNSFIYVIISSTKFLIERTRYWKLGAHFYLFIRMTILLKEEAIALMQLNIYVFTIPIISFG